MKSRYFAVAALMAGGYLPALAVEPPRAEKPQIAPYLKPGSFVEFTENLVSMGGCKRWQAKQATSDGMLVSQCNDISNYKSVENNFNYVKTVRGNGDVLFEFKPFMPELNFPLEVGKKWTGEYAGFSADNGDKWTSKLSCEVTAFEKVKVVAGELDAFRIDCADNWRAYFVFSGKKSSTRWYAPKVGSVIKAVSDDPKWNYQLTGYKLD